MTWPPTLPTRLGNALRSAEDYAGRVYGMDTVFWWPRLWPLLPEAQRETCDEALSQLVALLNFATLLIYVTLDSAVYLATCAIPYQSGWAALALALGAVIAWLAYGGAAAQARSYGQVIRTSIDLHRFELLKGLHCPLPDTPGEERAVWERLAAWLYNTDLGAAAAHTYDLGKPPEAKPDAGAPNVASPSRGLWALWRRFWGE